MNVARITACCVTLVATVGLRAKPAAAAAAPGRLVASQEPGWPQWRGPRRDGICDETGLLRSWPEGGPRLVWTISDLGVGYASPIVAGGRLYITGDRDQKLHIFAFDLNGKLKWQTTNGRYWAKPWPGSRSCCVVDGGRLFHMNAHGRVVCLDPADGEELWAVNILERFAGKNIRWALSECLLVDGERVIVTPGGAKALMAALDRNTGETLWATEPVDDVTAAYGSPILFALGGRRHLVNYSSHQAFGVDADTGKLLWRLPWPSGESLIGPTPVFDRNAVLVSSSARNGGATVRIELAVGDQGVEAKSIWTSPVDDMHGGSVLVGGRLYGSGHVNEPHLVCLDPQTGKVLYRAADPPRGAVLWAQGRLYFLAINGAMSLLEPGVDGFAVRGQFQAMTPKKKDAWTHPVICHGRLYLRYHDTLYCYDIKDE